MASNTENLPEPNVDADVNKYAKHPKQTKKPEAAKEPVQ